MKVQKVHDEVQLKPCTALQRSASIGAAPLVEECIRVRAVRLGGSPSRGG